jgi:hypothetical protein
MKAQTWVNTNGTNGAYRFQSAPGGGVSVTNWRESDGQTCTFHMESQRLTSFLDGLVACGYQLSSR